MATNKLMEAAADILAGSKKSATGMPSQKAEAEVVDLGGPTNQNSKPMDDSAKIDAAKAIKGKASLQVTIKVVQGKDNTLYNNFVGIA